MRKSNIIIKKVRNLMILSMAVIVIISVYFNILNSRAKETTDIVANVTDETGEVDSQKVTLVATGNKNGNYEISLPETISNVYVSNYKTLNGDKSANDKIVLSQDEVENKEINLEVNYDKKNVTSTKTNEEMTLYKQNLEYDDKGIYVEGYMPLLAQINVIQNENDISLEILYTVVESNNMSTKEIYVPSEYEQTLKITLNKKKYGVEQSLISSTDAEYIVVEQSDSKLVINNISSNTIDITNEEVPTIISSQYNGEDNKYYFAGGPIANSQIESIKFVTNPKEVLGTKWDASENGDNSVIAGYIDSNGNELYEIYVASNSDKTTKVYTPEDASYMFYECSNLTTIDIQNLGTSKTTNMNSMFAMCTNITTLELQNLDTSNVEDMENMFFGCENLETLDIINFITAKVTTMSNMFQNCKKLTELNLESFDTSKVIDMNSMFNGCESLTILNLNNFNTTEVTDMSWMFYNCKNITTLDISNFDTSHVTDMSGMFNHCENLTSLDVSKFDTSQVKSMRWMFGNCESLTNLDVRMFDTSQVTDMSYMFCECIGLTSLDVSKFDTSQVTNMGSMFYSCSRLTSLDVSKFDTSQVTNMGSMFYSCSRLTSLDVSKFDTSQVTNMGSMFEACKSLTSLDVSKFDTSQVTDMSYMFGEGEALETLDVSKLNTNQVINMDGMFHHCKNLISLDVSEFDTSHVTDMSGMFNHCENLTSLDVSKFDTSQVKSMRWMFGNCESLTNLDVRKFDTSQVINMKAMFQACRKLIELNISNFNTSQVTNMSYMFCNCSSLRSIYVSEYNETTGNGWTTKNVTDSDEMFTSATKLVGGNGTKFNSSYIDATYARIDKEGETGYLTDIGQASKTESYVGYYADVDGDGTVDGIIFADLLHGKTGRWGDSDGTYTIPTIESTKVKSYKVSQEDYTNQLGGTSKIIISSGEGEDRFYVMALTDITTDEYTLGCSMSGTTTTFGSGKTNTQTLIGKVDLNSSLKEQIQPKINKGWFIPSKEEWSAFGEELGITKSNYSYSANGLSDGYWSSSQSNAVTRSAWYANFKHGAMYYGYNNSYVRLATTF